MEPSDTQWAVANAIPARDGKGKPSSKRELKENGSCRGVRSSAKPRSARSKQEAKSAARFQTRVPKYSFVNGSGEGTIVHLIIVQETLFSYAQTNRSKTRWFNREAANKCFLTEFGADTPGYSIASGRISVNYQLVLADTLVKNGDLVIHTATFRWACSCCCFQGLVA
uniref:Uncharacterized protein n=1 Tax=Peronospora matthiolae TaxID=2874970 RepID=A0AAV1UHY8_9STRA